jgi:hypothetical protein
VNQISIFVLGSVMVFVSAPAPAQDFTAGKTPAQLFSSDCAECHRTPNGLARNGDVRTLAGFLREHYTTKSETAGALAAYVSGFAEDPAGRHRRTTSLSGDREKRRVDSEVPRPPAGILTTPASPKSKGRTRGREPSDAIDPISRLRSYLPSGDDAENAIEEAGKTGAPKAHKRRNRA